MAKYYPVLLNLAGLPCLVVGGGEVAERKVLSLLESGAQVRVISPEVTEKLKSLNAQAQIEWLPRAFCSGDAGGCCLVVSATDQDQVNSLVARECRAAQIPVNVVDDPANCSFIVPAVMRRGDLVIAVSTGGASPLLAGKIRGELEERYGPEYGEYLELLAEARYKLLQRVPDAAKRRQVLQQLTDGSLLDLVQAGRANEAKEWVEQCLSLR